MSDAEPKRGRGRPPKLKRCTRCNLEKRRRDYDNGRDDVCSFCKHEIRTAGGPRGTQGVDLMPGAKDDAPAFLPMKPAMREAITDALNLDVMTEALSKLFKPMPRCECCYEYRHVGRDTYGGVMLACARCDFQLRATGQCHLHHSKLVYPELAQPAAVPTPPEIEALFYVPESTKPKFDAAAVADATDSD